jgi:hypothetical protein
MRRVCVSGRDDDLRPPGHNNASDVARPFERVFAAEVQLKDRRALDADLARPLGERGGSVGVDVVEEIDVVRHGHLERDERRPVRLLVHELANAVSGERVVVDPGRKTDCELPKLRPR